MKRTALLAALAIFLLPVLLSAGPGAPPTARLRARASFDYGGHGLTRKDQEIFVTTARLVTGTWTSNYLASPWGSYWFADSLSKVARKAAYARLERDLLANGIASQEGDCSVAVRIAPTSGFYEITWFDGAQRKDLRVELTQDTSTCPLEIVNIINGINTFARSAGIRDFGMSVE